VGDHRRSIVLRFSFRTVQPPVALQAVPAQLRYAENLGLPVLSVCSWGHSSRCSSRWRKGRVIDYRHLERRTDPRICKSPRSNRLPLDRCRRLGARQAYDEADGQPSRGTS
jgi:hypothetical protein